MATIAPAPASPHRPSTVAGAVDVHQHLWPPELLSALAARHRLPRLRRGSGGWLVQLAGEPDAALSPDDHDPDRRATLARADGIDTVVVAPSVPIGIEALPVGEAAPLLQAYHDGVRRLPAPFRAWASTSLLAPDATALETHLDDGFVGLCLPAAGLMDRGGLERLAPVLDVLERRGAPLFVHPGPAPRHVAGIVDRRLPGWWAPMTAYVTQMHVAWHLWVALGRRAHPRLRVCFALLAGLAPLHAERRAARGGPGDVADAQVFYETSSYGDRAIRQMAGAVGSSALVFGSDRPVVAPPPGGDGFDPDETTRVNPARLLGWTEAS